MVEKNKRLQKKLEEILPESIKEGMHINIDGGEMPIKFTEKFFRSLITRDDIVDWS